jgi:uncharacterized protein (TIGR03083 family)
VTVAAGNTAAVDVSTIPRIERPEATALAEAEVARFADALAALDPDDWARPTANSLWDVRAMAGHVLGMTETFTSFRTVARDMRAAEKLRGEGPQVDGLTAQQVRLTAGLSTTELVDRLRGAGPVNARWRAQRRFMRIAPMKQEVPGNGGAERWRMGYLFDVILTRDTWMHRSDLAEATGRPMPLTPEHDGRIVADAVAEWARRHGEPFVLELTGPAGGSFVHGRGAADGESLTMDAVEWCRIVTGRPAATDGLLAVQVPF